MIEYTSHVKLLKSQKKGRYLVAASDLPANTVVIKEPAYASISKYPAFCSNCFDELLQPTEERPFLCDSCAEGTPTHVLGGFSVKDKSLVILCYKVALRLLSESDFSVEKFLELKVNRDGPVTDNYSCNFEAVAQLVTTDLEVGQADVYKVCNMFSNITDKISQDQLEDLVRHVFSTFQCNVQGIKCIFEERGKLSEERIGSGLYLTLALMNHSCSPNTRIYFEKSDVVVVTTAYVKQGEELFHNYGPDLLHHPKFQRQHILQRQYLFVCDCVACSVEGEKELPYSHCCEYCSAPIWIDVLRCSNCQQIINRQRYDSRIHSVMEKFDRLQDNSNQNVVFVDSIVHEATKLYSENNILFGNVMDSCAAFYADNKLWSKAIDCSKASCNVIKLVSGKLSHTYALEFMKLCVIRIKALQKGSVVEQLVEDVKFCIELLDQCKIYELKGLSSIKKWIVEIKEK